jgi:cytochrome b subunit of formate dehydrogenase
MRMDRLLPSVLFAAALLLVAPLASAASEECTVCHDEASEVAVHAPLDCAACHANVDLGEHPGGEAPAAPPDTLCIGCHAVAEVGESAHAQLDCATCHGDGHDVEAASEEVCGDCHDAGATLAGSVHAGAAKCRDCHGDAHAMLGHDEPRAPTSLLRQFETCGHCHADDDSDPVGRYLNSSHARALLLKGLNAAPSCTSCHGSHAILRAGDEDSLLHRAAAPRTCGGCHGFVLDTWVAESSHGILWEQGSDRGPVCTDCHPSHQAQRISERQVVLKTPERCRGCHDDQYSTYGDSFHGKATSLGFFTGATCSDCHTPHRNLPADDPRSSIHPDRLQATCGACHGEVSAQFVSFNPHADPSDRERNPELYVVWLFMTTLLLSVFGFFGVHDLLWLQRSIVALWRGEVETRPIAPGPHVRRFSPSDVWLHVSVVVSFLLLAATGLPLKFHDSGWAQMIAGPLGGIVTMRLLHRLAAIVTFGYAVFHVGSLLHARLVRNEGARLWGWRSLVPQPRDLVDLFRNLRYFFYLGPRPKIDRWAYWEKFDYFAVFWGIPIIGGSGLVLWFPEAFSRLLPGWALNAAALIHSDEALLAVGFIFVFHFFHAHLRPESFPFDPVIFTGRMPLDRFREERPVEYERLLRSGELESRIEPAPSERLLWRARIFGYTAVAIGLTLAVGVFWALLIG